MSTKVRKQTNIFPRRSSLAVRLFGALTLVALISVAGLGIAAFGEERNTIRTQLSNQLTSIVELKEEQIVNWLDERQSDARLLAVNKLNQEHLTEMQLASIPEERKIEFANFLTDNLIGMQGARTGYNRILISDVNGRILLATDPSLVGGSIVEQEIYWGIMASPDGSYVQDIYAEPSTGGIEMGFGHIMYAVDPVTLEELPQKIGMVVIAVDIEKTIYPLIGVWPGIGETGEALLVRANGEETLFLSNLRFEQKTALNLRVSTSSEMYRPAHLAARGAEGILESTDYRGVPVLAAYRHIPGVNWGFVAKVDLEEAFKPVEELAQRIGVIALIVFLAAGVLSIRLAQTLSKPLVQLVGAAEEVTAGNLKTDIAIDRKDEIGLLALAFQTMTNALEQRQTEVDLASFALQERTGELEALAEISSALRDAEGIAQMLPIILEKVVGFVNAELGVIYLVDQETGELVARDSLPIKYPFLGGRLKFGEGITGQVAEQDEVFITNNLAVEPYLMALPGEGNLLRNVRSAISLPLRTRKTTLGVIHIGFSARHEFEASEVNLLKAMAEIGAGAIHRAVVMQSLESRVEARTQELARANERLQELDRLKSKFVSDVSHELRTPVANLTLYLDLLERKPGRLEHYLPPLHQQTKRLAQLIEDILNLSRLESSAERPIFGNVNLNKLVSQISETYRPQIEGKGLRLIVTLDPSIPPIRGDLNQLAQVVTNLLANAINFTSAGYVSLCTNLGEDGTVNFQMIDSGVGIDEVDMPHLFERFYRGRLTGESDLPGTGLGLAIVKEIVDMHHGRITVRSVVDSGSTFDIWLSVNGGRDISQIDDDA